MGRYDSGKVKDWRCKAYKSRIWCWLNKKTCEMENCRNISEQEEKLVKTGKHSLLKI